MQRPTSKRPVRRRGRGPDDARAARSVRASSPCFRPLDALEAVERLGSLAFGRAQVGLVLALLVAGCSKRDAHDAPKTNASASSPVVSASSIAGGAPSAVASLHDTLADQAITEASFARRVLWSWTTRAQAEVLRAQRALLLDTQLPEGPTAYVRRLEQVAARTDAVSELARLLLGHPNLKLRRYAWTRPWATRRGLADRDYGDQLIRVTLKANAIVGRFDPSRSEPFTFRDLDDRPVPFGEVLNRPDRLAAILHVFTTTEAPVKYREYVLCNESAVAEWALATDDVRAAIAADRALVEALAVAPPTIHGGLAEHWSGAPAGALALYAAAVPFDNERYRPTAENLRSIAKALESSLQVGPKLVVVPTLAFANDVPSVPFKARTWPPSLFVV